MKNVRELLRDADPLRHESMTSSEQRDFGRQAVLAAAAGAHARGRTESRSRVALLIIVASIVIAASFLAERMWSPLVGDVHAAVRFEVRLAEDKPTAGLREAKISGTDRSIYLHDEVIVTNSDISSARIIQVGSSSQYNVGVEFNATRG